MKNKPVIGLIALVCTVIFVLASTLAWFASTDARENKFKTKFKFNVELVDEFKQPETFKPEQLVAKKVSAVNTGDINAFVRVMVFPVATLGQTPLPIDDGVEVVYEQLNTTDWLAGSDGYYYYLRLLLPGEEAAALFNGVTLKLTNDRQAEFADAYIDIIVKTEAAGTNDYRLGWWGSQDAPAKEPYQTIDNALQVSNQ